jgi:hypothetical protein
MAWFWQELLDDPGDPLIARKLATIRDFRFESVTRYAPRFAPKLRWLCPPILIDGKVQRLSTIVSL